MNIYDMADVKKYYNFLKENFQLSETDIREYIREELNTSLNNLFVKVNTKFPLDDNKISDVDEKKLESLIEQFIDLYSIITINNISNFERTWELGSDKIKEGDYVIDNETEEQFYVTRFGVNNNFYDSNKHKFVSLDRVRKKE